MKFKIRDIQPNPFRHMENYPIRRDKVEALRKSLRTTGFWDNVVARLDGDGKPQIAYGHHRWTALNEEYEPDHEVELIVRDLDDTHMLQIMAAENMEEWGTSALVEIETINAVVEAYGAGKIELEAPNPRTPVSQLRFAPGFVQGDVTRPVGSHPYGPQTVARFLGWTKPSGDAQDKVQDALAALEFFDLGILSREDFAELGSVQMHAVVQQARQAKADQERRAREAEEAAERARTEREQAEARQRQAEARQRQAREQAERDRAEREAELERQRAAAAQRRQNAEAEAARQARQRATEQASRVGRHVSGGMRRGEIATKKAAEAAREAYEPEEKADQLPKTVAQYAQTVGTVVVRTLSPDTDIARRLEFVVMHKNSLTDYQRQGLARELRDLAFRANGYAEQLSEAFSISEGPDSTPAVVAGHIETGQE